MSLPPSEHSHWFAEEVLPLEQSLRSYLRQSLRSPADVDDLLQDSYLRILNAKRKGAVRSTKPLLFAIARNAVRDFLQRSRKADVVPMDEDVLLPVLHEERSLVESVCHEQELALLEAAIASLPERCREVILLRKIKRLPQREIAELLGISENTVKTLVARGARRIDEYFAAHGLGARQTHEPEA